MTDSAPLFHSIYQIYRTAISDQSELPKQIFHSAYRKFYFFEFDRAFSARFWSVLQKLASQSQDTWINVISIDPHPVDYFHKEFGLFGATRVSSLATDDENYEELCSHPPNNHLDSLFHSETLAWFPDSAKWFVFGERAYGIAILGIQNGFAPPMTLIAQESKMPILSLSEALSDIVSLNFRNLVEFEKFSAELKANYPN